MSALASPFFGPPRVRLHLTFDREVGANHLGNATPDATPMRETIVEWDEPDAEALVAAVKGGFGVGFRCELHGDLLCIVTAAKIERDDNESASHNTQNDADRGDDALRG